MKYFDFVHNFGLNITNKLTLNKLMYKISKNDKFLNKNNKLIVDWLFKEYGSNLNNEKFTKTLDKNFKVWVFWWQGLDKAPELVKSCVSSIKHNYPNNEVVILDRENISNYVNIPRYIMEKVENKVITLTHFSDILRATLLSDLGGVWMDATMFMTERIDSEIMKYSLYSNKYKHDERFSYSFAKTDWSAFFLASAKNNPVAVNLKNVLYKYWEKHDTLINYFLIDAILRLIYEKCDNCRNQFESIPYNNPNIHNLQPLLLKHFDEKQFKIATEDTKIFKLTYKLDYEKKDDNSFYDYILGGKE